MKLIITITLTCLLGISARAQLNLGGMLKDKVNQRANNAASKKMDQGLDSITTGKKKTAATTKADDTKNAPDNQKNDNAPAKASGESQPLTAYNNYDFVPGNDIVFEDNFYDSQDGEFPPHWDLASGQGVVNKVGSIPAFMLTEGNYVKVSPLIKGKNYVSDPFTVEFDYYANDGYGVNVFFETSATESEEKILTFSDHGDVNTGYFGRELNATYPGNHNDFRSKWHHAALIYKSKQIKCYVDQYRVLVIPNCNFVTDSLKFGGIGSIDHPIVFTNIRIANGGNMNMLDQIMTSGKFMTHAITFDVDKATIKPESMGFLNELSKWLKTNAAVKLEIDGHTDNSGNAAHNQTLSEQRADAVKTELISLGIDASRFTTKGFGLSKPISANDTPEGRANNRRVEFVKM